MINSSRHYLRRLLTVAPSVLAIVTGSLIAQTAQPSPVGYILGADDQIVIRVPNAEELSEKPVSIGLDGYISLPMVGHIHAAGLTVEQLEMEIAKGLTPYLREPQVSLSIVDFQSQPVSVLGAVETAGVIQLRGHKTLFEVISAAGGLRSEAGNDIKITRRHEFGSIPLPGAAPDPSGEFSVAQVSVKSVMEARKPQENIEVKPYDVISIPRAELIYVIGAVKRAGGFVLNERGEMTVLQALSMAEGLDSLAAGKNGKIMRPSEDSTTRTEIPVDVNKILAGKIKDVPMQVNDILFIPSSAAKSATHRGIETAIEMGTAAIWHF